MLTITDQDRVRLLTLDRPDALNAFNEALYDAVSEALIEAAGDDAVATVVITGSGRAFSAGQDLLEMSERITNPDFVQGSHGFPGLIDQLAAFPKPLLLAINGLGLGIGIVAEMAVRDDPPGGDLVWRPAGQLFGQNVARIAFKRGAYLRNFVYKFAEMISERLSRALITRSINGVPSTE